MVGRIMLVGAGPGDPDLLTLKAVKTFEQADVVVYDRLVSSAILGLLPEGVARIDVGKQPNCHPVPQDEINETLIRLGRAGHRVVRLKGGDPFLFGRGGEEAVALRAAGIPFEIIPGITAAQGCAASVGLPLTHRTFASSVRYLTGHCRGDEPLDFDWPGLADPGTTLVVYMGLANIAEIAGQLMLHGRGRDTPVLAISRGTQPDERLVYTKLGCVSADVAAADLPSPTLFVIGEVVGLMSPVQISRHVLEENLVVSAAD